MFKCTKWLKLLIKWNKVSFIQLQPALIKTWWYQFGPIYWRSIVKWCKLERLPLTSHLEDIDYLSSRLSFSFALWRPGLTGETHRSSAEATLHGQISSGEMWFLLASQNVGSFSLLLRMLWSKFFTWSTLVCHLRKSPVRELPVGRVDCTEHCPLLSIEPAHSNPPFQLFLSDEYSKLGQV